jgi:hypothetical protein
MSRAPDPTNTNIATATSRATWMMSRASASIGWATGYVASSRLEDVQHRI